MIIFSVNKLFIPIKEISERVPNKNFRTFSNEKKLWEWCIEKFSDFEIYLDTDSDEILDESCKYPNVTAYRRSEKLIGHDVSVCDLIEYCINRNNINGILCQIHVTSPFLNPSTVRNAISYMEKYDSVVSCNEVQTRFWRKEGYGYCPVNHNPFKLENTQDLPKYYEENSAFYIFNTPTFKKSKSRIGLNPYFYTIDFPENLDIDNEDDWNLATSYINNGKEML